MASHANESTIKIFKEAIQYLSSKGHKPGLNMMDNKHSKSNMSYINKHSINIQRLGVTRSHHLNAAEKTIAKFKGYFIAELKMIDINWSMQLA